MELANVGVGLQYNPTEAGGAQPLVGFAHEVLERGPRGQQPTDGQRLRQALAWIPERSRMCAPTGHGKRRIDEGWFSV